MQNWIEGPNPFGLKQPAAWWLQQLFDYDPELVIFPSQKDHVYRLARRTPRDFQLGQSVAIVHQHPDTTLMINHGLVPVGTVLTWAIATDKIIRELRSRDTWRVGPGGKDKAADNTLDILEGRDLAQAEKLEKAAYDALNAHSGEAFRSMQARNGTRLSQRGPRSSEAPLQIRRVVRGPIAPPRHSPDKNVISHPSSVGPAASPDHNSVILTDA